MRSQHVAWRQRAHVSNGYLQDDCVGDVAALLRVDPPFADWGQHT